MTIGIVAEQADEGSRIHLRADTAPSAEAAGPSDGGAEPAEATDAVGSAD